MSALFASIRALAVLVPVLLLASPLPAALGSPVADGAEGREGHVDSGVARTPGLRQTAGSAVAATAEVAEAADAQAADMAGESETKGASCRGPGASCLLNSNCCSLRCSGIRRCRTGFR
mmetsp:Transcript_29061/g.77637  ORF Transcript_29061/g.77637 Transcript_29061/m.77637 type:complete len:119 (+) Transcript_29061:73-429(+)